MSVLPNVEIELVRDGLGLIAGTNDNTCALICPGVAVADLLVLNTPYAIYSTDGARELGIEPDGVNAVAFKQIAEFYAVAGVGAKLWVMIVAATVKLSDMVDPVADPSPAKVLISAGAGEIVALGCVSGAATATTVDGLDEDVYAAMVKGQVLADSFTDKIMPYVTVLEGKGFSDADSLRDLSGEDKYRIAVALCATSIDTVAAIGLVLGSIAANPVQRKISRIKNGALPITSGFLTDAGTIEEREDLATIHGKRYIILRKFPNRSGYFFNGDFTATSQTDDLNLIARVRVIDKAMKIAYNTYVEELDDDVEVNNDGTLNRSVAAYLKDKIEAQVNGAMAGEISRFEATVDTSIDILAGNAQKIFLDIVPRGYLNPIRVVLGFKNE